MNSESAQSSNKRLVDNDDLSHPEKQLKQENRIVLKDNNFLQKYEEETINLACTEKNCEIKESRNRNSYTDFVAKFEIPFEQFEKEKTTFLEKLVSKNNETYNFSLSNILYDGTVSSSMIFLFQNKPGLSDKQFEQEVSAFENNFVLKNLEEEKRNQLNLTEENLKEKNDDKDSIGSQNVRSKDEYKSHAEDGHVNKGEILKENEKMNLDFIETNFSNRDSIFENHANHINPKKETRDNTQVLNQDKKMEIDEDTNLKIENENQLNKILTDKVLIPLQGVYYNINEETRGKRIKINNNQRTNIADKIPTVNIVDLTNQGDSQNILEMENENVKETYDIQISVYLLDFKIIQKTFQKVKEGEILEMRMDIPTNFYTEFKGDGVSIVSEVFIRKNYDSPVKYNGIINEAMTCYMNSLIQTLFHIGYFRKAVFQIPLDVNEKPGESVVYSLQRLFFDLMQEKTPASTNKLIGSFGWSREEIFIQHDVQEFNLMLNDLMENKMKGTKSEGTFKYLFEGTSENYIECIEVPYRSIKVEKFYDLQLTVKNCKNIYESLQKFTEVETLEGDNMYEAEGHGKQKAKKGVRFVDFPRVLMFQLKRFEYNPIKDYMEKINEKFEFTDELILDDFVTHKDSNLIEKEDPKIENTQKMKYKYSLYSVVVHKGTIDRGHYYAFIKPEHGNQWYQFNDEIVRNADPYEVFANNYGGNFKIYKHKERGIINEITQKSDGNAYLLVYIRDDLLGEILQKVTTEDIPPTLIERFNKDKEYEKRQLMLRVRSKKNMDIHLFSKEMLLNHLQLGAMPSILELQDVTDLLSNNTFWTKISVPKDMKILELREYISKTINIPEKYILLYTYVIRDQKNLYKNIIKRHEFKMHLIEESAMREQKISTINSYNESKPTFRNHIFLFIDFALKNPNEILFCKNNPLNNLSGNEIDMLKNLDLQIFEKNETYEMEKDLNFEDVTEQEYVIDETQQKMIYYKFDNFWKFKNLELIPNKIFDLLEYKENNYDDFRLIILKDIVFYANEIRIKIINAFSLPVDKKCDKILTEQIIKYTISNKIDFYDLAEKIKKEEYKDINIGIYLETTVFEPETNQLLKKHLLLKKKREAKFYKNIENRVSSVDDFSRKINNPHPMDIEKSEKYHTDKKEKELGIKRNHNPYSDNGATNKNICYSEGNKIITSPNVKSSFAEKQLLENKSNLELVTAQNENELENHKINTSVHLVDTSDKIQNGAQFKSGESSNKEDKVINEINSKTLSLIEQENNSHSSSKNGHRIHNSNLNSNKSSENHESDNKSSVSSEENKSLNEHSSSRSNKKESLYIDNNSMVNNPDCSSGLSNEKQEFNSEKNDNTKRPHLRNPITNSNGRVKTYRKILGLKRNNDHEKEITYQNLSSLNKQENADHEEGTYKMNGNNIINNNHLNNSKNIEATNAEEDQSISQEDETILQQEITELDEFLFRVELLTADKLNRLYFFSDSNEGNIDPSKENFNDLKDSNTKEIEPSQNYIEVQIDSNIDSKNSSKEVHKFFESFTYNFCFNKCNSDALIFFLFPEKNFNLHVLNQWHPRIKLAEYFEDQLNSVFVPIEFIFANKNKDLYGPKGNPKFKLRLDSDYDQTLISIIEYFNFNLENFNLEHIFLQDEITPNILFYNEHRKLATLETFLSNINKDYFFIKRTINLEQVHQNSYNFIANLIEKYPLIKFMDSKDALYKLTLQLIPFKLRNIRNYINKDVTLYDIDNNPIIKIYFAFPNHLTECHEFLKYISDDVLKYFYSDIYDDEEEDAPAPESTVSHQFNNYEKSNSQKSLDKEASNCIAHEQNQYFSNESRKTRLNENLEISEKNAINKNENIINSLDFTGKDNITDLNECENNQNKISEKNLILFNNDNKIKIRLDNFKFLLQHHKRYFAYDIFVNNEEELFKYEKMSLNICYRIQPLRNEDWDFLKHYDKIFVAFCRRDSSAFCDPIIISLPNETTIGQMKKVIFNKLKKIKSTQSIEYSKIKYYIYSLIDYRPHKDNLLINSKDEEKIAHFFKKGPRNVLVELLQMEGDSSGKELNMMG